MVLLIMIEQTKKKKRFVGQTEELRFIQVKFEMTH